MIAHSLLLICHSNFCNKFLQGTYQNESSSCLSFGLVWFMVLNATFNNISVISWPSVLLVEKTGVPGENN